MEVLTISRSDCAILAARFTEHGNSQRRMLAALEEASAKDVFTRLALLRQIEKMVGVDLGMLCYHFEHRNDATTHPFQRAVMNYVAHWRINMRGGEDLWVMLERVRQVKDIVEEGHLAVSAPEPEN